MSVNGTHSVSEPIPVDSKISVLIVDTLPSLRVGLSLILNREADISVVGDSGNVDEALNLFHSLHPDITLIEVKLGSESGIAVAERMRAEFPKAKIVFFTASERDEDIYRCIRSGASGFILKSTPVADILMAIRSINQGRKYFDPTISEKLSERISTPELSEREYEVLRRMTDGCSNKEIASLLGLSVGTIKYHINSILGKLDAVDRTQAVVIGLRKGLTEL